MGEDSTPVEGPTTFQPLRADDVVDLLNAMADRPYTSEGTSEAVDERTHALQAAELAVADNADDELVIAAALHDIGRAAPVQGLYPDLPHEEAGGAFLRERLGERIAWVVEHHVPAKRYLVATDPAYRAVLSPTSVRTLRQQGGPMTAAEVARFERHPWHADAVTLRRWDDRAKDPDRTGLSMDELVAIYRRLPAAAEDRR